MDNIPVIMIIFGGSGDLAHRKLYPALFNLYEKGLIKKNFAVIGTARRPWSHEYLRGQVQEAISESVDNYDKKDAEEFASHFYYQSHDVTDVDHYIALKHLAEDLDKKYDAQGNRIFYMAMAPRFFGTIASHINDQHLVGPGFNRLVVEKPFGHDLASAEELNKTIQGSFKEENVYRIDHYLGKEMVLNITPFRAANPLVRSVWNKDLIENIQITVGESLGVGTRGGYYDTSGALRDMVQNHIFQIITLLAMPEPEKLNSKEIHQAKQELLASLHIPTLEDVEKYFVRGQYAAANDKPAYLQEDQVALDSMTETYAAGRVVFGEGPIANVPIYYRTGKEMKEKKTRIDIVLKTQDNPYGEVKPNVLTIIVDPEKEIRFTINGKEVSGNGLRLEELDFGYSKKELAEIPDGYERLIHDILVGDNTNFTHWAELKQYWKYIDAVEQAWEAMNQAGKKPETYQPMSFGPEKANDIFANKKDYWIYQ